MIETLPAPYYHDEANGITIYCGDALRLAPLLPPASVDLVLTDPPYDDATHEGARTNVDDKLISFAPIPIAELRAFVDALAPLARRWYVATMAWEHVAAFKAEPPEGWRFVRFGVWVKPNGAPQFTGDRPGTGWEAVCHLHRADAGALKWNGGGRHGVYIHDKIAGPHPTMKPPGLLRELLELFSDPGDLVLDPFMGSGATLVQARAMGRRAIGIERDEAYCALAVRALAQSTLPGVAVPAQRAPRKPRDLWKLYGDVIAGKEPAQ